MKPVKHKTSRNKLPGWWLPLIIVIALAALALAFRAPLSAAFNPPTLTPATLPTPGGMLEQAGSVEVRQMEGVQALYLFAEPDEKSEKISQVQPGERGELLGQDASGEWLYVRFGDHAGWAPIYFFNVTAVQ